MEGELTLEAENGSRKLGTHRSHRNRREHAAARAEVEDEGDACGASQHDCVCGVDEDDGAVLLDILDEHGEAVDGNAMERWWSRWCSGNRRRRKRCGVNSGGGPWRCGGRGERVVVEEQGRGGRRRGGDVKAKGAAARRQRGRRRMISRRRSVGRERPGSFSLAVGAPTKAKKIESPGR